MISISLIKVVIEELRVIIYFYPVRDKTKLVLDLLSDEKLIEEERESAKRIKEKLQGNKSLKYLKLSEELKLLVVIHHIYQVKALSNHPISHKDNKIMNMVTQYPHI